MRHRYAKPCSHLLFLLTACIGPLALAQHAVCPTRDAETVDQQPARKVRQAYQSALQEHVSLADLPVGIFDSGTGGLTVLEQILELDVFDNQTKLPVPGGDNRPDFETESFMFLADQANMPYGNYPAVGKADLLTELIVQDARFLMGSEYFRSSNAKKPETTKLPVKAIVIACNTATAYGKRDIETFVADAGLSIEVIGVIEGGAKGALKVFSDRTGGTVGVVATQGTVLSGAYPAAIKALAEEKGLSGQIRVVQQGALGLAGAIDGELDFINRSVRDRTIRAEYRGPSLVNREAPIDLSLLLRYDFEFSDKGVLFEGDPGSPSALQLNSVDNYIAYHLVTLLEKLRNSSNPRPLRAVILGCTHFPFYADTFRRELARLYDYQENDQFVYRRYMVKDVKLIDPAFYTAKELHEVLSRGSKHRKSTGWAMGDTRTEFFITVPRGDNPSVKLNSQGWFTYDYKYGRSKGITWSDVRAVPLGESNVGPDVLKRLSQRVPSVWELLNDFHRNNSKVKTRHVVSPSCN